MRIAINLLPYTSYQGIETYTKNLINGMLALDAGHEIILITHRETPGFFDFGDRVTRIVVPLKKINKATIALYQQTALYWLLFRLRPEVLLSTSPASPYFYWKNVITFHDCAYDRYKEFANLPSKLYFQSMYIAARFFAKKIVTISHFSKRELMDVYKIPEKKIAVVLEGPPALPEVDETFVAQTKTAFNIDDRYFFYVGNSRPRKNLPGLLRAFAVFAKKNPDVQLVLAGKIDNRFEDIDAMIAALGLQEHVLRVGFITDEQKVALYKGAISLVFPSFYEGFGLPVLEAQSLGVPVLTSRTSSLPEVGGDSVLYVDPESQKSLVQGLTQMAGSKTLREKLMKKGYQNCKRFSWEKAAAESIVAMR